MKRRELIKKASLGATVAALSFKVIPSMAQQCSEGELALTGEIEANHGHAVEELNDATLIQKSRTMKDDDTLEIDITGNSRHPHTLSLSKSDIMQLLVDKELTVISSTDSRHSHSVLLILE